MKTFLVSSCPLVLLSSLLSFAPWRLGVKSFEKQRPDLKHLLIYHEKGRFGGWPANHGIWSWGNEILVGFEAGYFRDNASGHAIDYSRPAEHVLARSLDGGETWKIERPEGLRPPAGMQVAGVPTGEGGKEPADCPGGIDFSSPGFAFTARMASIH